ncbi:MAG: hypothetical protein C4562_01090 [Actinobacteria bacterium]|nr:MAG: hypothetical protein C4562_01090 [Actinomycetota bacterium]
MRAFLIIGNGEVKNSLTLEEYNVKNHIHSVHESEQKALRLAHWLNGFGGLRFHVEERQY